MAFHNHSSSLLPDFSQRLVSCLEPEFPQSPLPAEEKILRKLMCLLNEDFAPRAAMNSRHFARGDA